MSSAKELQEYVGNIRPLLRAHRARFGMMVNRQIRAQLLPTLRGSRAELEPFLWELLLICLDGEDAPMCDLDDVSFAQAQKATQDQTALDGSHKAAFSQAAVAVLETLLVLREAGVYPPPKR